MSPVWNGACSRLHPVSRNCRNDLAGGQTKTFEKFHDVDRPVKPALMRVAGRIRFAGSSRRPIASTMQKKDRRCASSPPT
jgi:hypothetical protein